MMGDCSLNTTGVQGRRLLLDGALCPRWSRPMPRRFFSHLWRLRRRQFLVDRRQSLLNSGRHCRHCTCRHGRSFVFLVAAGSRTRWRRTWGAIPAACNGRCPRTAGAPSRFPSCHRAGYRHPRRWRGDEGDATKGDVAAFRATRRQREAKHAHGHRQPASTRAERGIDASSSGQRSDSVFFGVDVLFCRRGLMVNGRNYTILSYLE